MSQQSRRHDPYPWTWEVPVGVMLVIFLVLVCGVHLGRAIANALGRLAGDFHSGGTGRGMSGPVEIREERLVCITSSEPAGEHLADWPPSTPDQVHQLRDESPGVAASQSAIGPGSVRPTCASLRFRRSEA